MSGHSRWLMEKRAYPAPCTVAYTQGYILALEDVLKDLDQVRVDVEAIHGDPYAVERIRDIVKVTMIQAKHTLEVLTK